VRKRATFIASGAVFAFLAWSGCRSGPEPQQLFAEAEALRLKYEKDASHEAIAKYGEVMNTWRRRGQTRDAARAGRQIGVTYAQLGSLHASLQSYQSALSLATASRDPMLESEIRSAVGFAEALVAESEAAFETARRQCETALELARKSPAGRETGQALNCLGEVAYHRQRPVEALEFYAEAARVWESIGDQRGQAETLYFQGSVYSDARKFDQARICFERSRSLWTLLDDKRQLAVGLVADARLHLRRGEHQAALNTFEDALSRLRAMGDAVWEASSLTGIAEIHQEMGDTRLAAEYWERALELFDTAGLRSVSVDVLGTLGDTYLASSDDVKALDRFERALALAQEQGIQHWKAKALRFIGVVYLFRAVPGRAREYLERSLDEQRGMADADPRLEARTRADLGEAHDLSGDRATAMTSFTQALAISTSAGDRVAEARALFGLARVSMQLDDLDRARDYVERSLKVAESLRTRVESRDLRASYLATVYEYSEFHVDVLMRMHRIHPRNGLAVAAFEASERARARSLLESLTEAQVDIRLGVDPELLAREQAVQKSLGESATRLRKASGAPATDAVSRQLAAEYRELEDRYNRIQAEIRSKSPHYAALAQPRPSRLDEVQRQILDANTLVLEYALGNQRSYLWCVSNTEQASYELAPRAEIEQVARRAYERLTARISATGSEPDRRRQAAEADTAYWLEAARLSDMLLGPVAKNIIGKRLLIVPDGALQYMPFAALPVPGRDDRVPMFVEHEIVSLPSASVLALLRRETRNRQVPDKAVAILADPVFESDDPRLRTRAAVQAAADRPHSTLSTQASLGMDRALRGIGVTRDGKLRFPRLASTGQEADAIVAAAPAGTALRATDFQASRATTMSANLARYRIVHFATHSVFNNDDPGSSGIVLSMFDERGEAQDGFLRLHDIYTLRLPAELIVLSACSTALGKPVKGEGLVGIVRGFMYAGAKRVLASLWKVDDDATAELMSHFYAEMLKKNRSPAAALQQAQLAMWHEDRWRPPFYWAAFVMQGEWN
jgi:CHAT domain-containing protein